MLSVNREKYRRDQFIRRVILQYTKSLSNLTERLLQTQENTTTDRSTQMHIKIKRGTETVGKKMLFTQSSAWIATSAISVKRGGKRPLENASTT